MRSLLHAPLASLAAAACVSRGTRHWRFQLPLNLPAGCGLFLPYGSGTVLGVLANDTATWGGYTIPNQSFGQITEEPGAGEWR